jgi:hypothetical protein
MLCVPGALALTRIELISDPGDYVGGGETFSLTLADGTIVASPYSGGIEVRFNGTPPVSPKTFWTFWLVPVAGGALLPGNYPSAQRMPFQSPRHPGLSIFGDGRGCNELTGIFTVHEAVFDGGGNVVAFAADAEQHCEGASAALRTRIRINSSVPMIVSVPQAVPGLPQEAYEGTLVTLDGSQSYEPAGQIVAWGWSQVSGPPVTIETPAAPVTRFRAPQVPPGGADVRLNLVVTDASGNRATGTVAVHVFDRRDRRTWLTWRSPPGDYIGGGVPLAFSLADGDAALALPSGMSVVNATFRGATFNSWRLDFAAADGAALGPGTYPNAQRFPFQAAGQPGLGISGSGRGCNTLTGQFTVMEFDAAVSPTRFGARFVQSCEGFMPPLRGSMLFNAVAPGNPVARISGPAYAPAGTGITLDGTSSSSAGSLLVSYSWRQLAGPPVTVSDPTQPTLHYTMPAGPASSMRFELEVMDEEGLVDVAEFATAGSVEAAVPTLRAGLIALLAAAMAAGGVVTLGRRRRSA